MKSFYSLGVVSRRRAAFLLGALSVWGFGLSASGKPDPHWLEHDRRRPQPRVVQPGTFSSEEEPGRPPSDATALYDGHGLSQWVAMDGSPTKWIERDGVMQCVPGSGYIRTAQCFGDCQLHVEWATPTPPKGEGQGRGNSGVFFGYDRYEIQVLDSYHNTTYADGSAASVYGQYPPLVNASRPPGQWQVYDIIWTSPRFNQEGKLLAPARVTVFHNGVLAQNNVELTGPTSWLARAPYEAHPEKLPIALQDHGNPVRYRNIWVRELQPGRKEFMLSDALLESYAGDYERGPNDIVKVRRAHDGLLSLSFGGQTFVMHAESPAKFFATTTDVQCEFRRTNGGQEMVFSVGEGGMHAKKVQ